MGTPPLAGIHAALQYPYAEVTDDAGVVKYMWPAIADPNLDWEAMTDAEAAALADIYGLGLIELSRDQGEYSNAWWVEIDATGAWTKVAFIWD